MKVGKSRIPNPAEVPGALFKRKDIHGHNPNLKGPNGEPSEILKAQDVHGKEVTIPHHKHGHKFKDNKTFEKSHHHGPHGEHLSYD